MAKLPSLKYVKFTRAKGRVYAYFNSGRKVNGKIVWLPLPAFGSVGFFDSYTAMLGNRNKRASAVFTMRDFIHRYESSDAFKRLSKSTRATYGQALKRIGDELGDAPVEQIERRDIRHLIENKIDTSGVKNLVLKITSALFAWGRAHDLTDLKPTEGIKPIKAEPYEPWPADLLRDALASDNARVRLVVHLLYYTGQRVGDVLKMRWNDVRDGAVHVRQQKTSKALHIPLTAELQAELDATPRQGLTIVTARGGRQISVVSIRRELQAFAADHGLEVVPHGLRKNAVNALLLAGCTIAEVGAITGQTYQVVEHYARQIDQRRLGEAAIFKLGTKREVSNHVSNRPVEPQKTAS